MRNIRDGIVYSNDIYLILQGYNNLDYNYKGLIIPEAWFIEELRKQFKRTVDKIFKKTTIISEEEMTRGIITSIRDVFGIYPHCFIR